MDNRTEPTADLQSPNPVGNETSAPSSEQRPGQATQASISPLVASLRQTVTLNPMPWIIGAAGLMFLWMTRRKARRT